MTDREIDYALAKKVPSIARLARFETDYGLLVLEPEDSQKVAALVETLLAAKLRKADHS